MTRFPRTTKEAIQMQAATFAMRAPSRFPRQETRAQRAVPWKEGRRKDYRNLFFAVGLLIILALAATLYWWGAA